MMPTTNWASINPIQEIGKIAKEKTRNKSLPKMGASRRQRFQVDVQKKHSTVLRY